GVAILGALLSRSIPAAPSADPQLAVQWDPVRPTLALLRLARAYRPIWLAILGISWFWTFGSIFLSLFPTYTRSILGGNEALATLFLAMFSVGIGIGSLLCHQLSRERVELGLVPVGSLGMTLFTLDLWWVGQPWPLGAVPMTVPELLSNPTGWRICVDLGLLAVFGGFLIVPLYSFIQARAKPEERSRIIAANNVINAFWMVIGSLALAGVYSTGASTVDVLLVLALVNLAVGVYMYTVVAEFLLRFAAWVLSFVIYRIDVQGEEHIPREGPCVLVANHVSFVDWFVLMAAVRRPPRFVMYHTFMKLPIMRFFFRQAKVIPIAGRKEDPALLEAAFERIHEDLQAGWVVAIFPEGTITTDGTMSPFRLGIERILERDPVPVVPIAINGLWGSFFSRAGGRAMTKPFRRLWSRVAITIGEPIPGAGLTAEALQEQVQRLWELRAQGEEHVGSGAV
ncbi:MAG TPA: MFS transporter, partial [Deltaproteobacteria bacterium]|nr:MFS transporter [Deltaproteobacteria bacterium]